MFYKDSLKNTKHQEKLINVCDVQKIAFEPVREKTNNLGSDQVRHKPGCKVTEDG